MLRRRVRTQGPLRVLFVVPDLEIGGAERQVTTLLPALDPARIAASLVCVGPPGALFAGLVAAGGDARALDMRRRPVAALAALVTLMLRTRPDVVVMRGYNAEMLGRLATTVTGVPRTVVWVHQSRNIIPRGRFRRVADRVLDPVTSAYFGVAEHQRAFLTGGLGSGGLGYPDAKVRIVRNGVALAGPAPHSGRDDALVGIVGVLRPEKDHATFLHAARIVATHTDRARFVVVGDGPLRAASERLAHELGIADRVEFTGARTDVAELLATMAVFVLSSRTETLPMALLEAMSAGVPVVATAVGGIPDAVEDGVSGILVPPEDPARLAAAVLDLLGDPDRAAATGRAARTTVRAAFGIEQSVEAAQLAIEETAGRGAHRASTPA